MSTCVCVCVCVCKKSKYFHFSQKRVFDKILFINQLITKRFYLERFPYQHKFKEIQRNVICHSKQGHIQRHCLINNRSVNIKVKSFYHEGI